MDLNRNHPEHNVGSRANVCVDPDNCFNRMHKRVVGLSTVADVTANFEPTLATVIVETPVAQSFLTHKLYAFNVLQLLEVSAVTQAMLRAVAHLARCQPSLIPRTWIFFFAHKTPCFNISFRIIRKLLIRQEVKCDVRLAGFFYDFHDEIRERSQRHRTETFLETDPLTFLRIR
uniref:(northern house mosquito) hypothetical protein n=1 Tax=Culex pipiens TaxID=7175 RepID=A0A8D8BIG9_CULPI